MSMASRVVTPPPVHRLRTDDLATPCSLFVRAAREGDDADRERQDEKRAWRARRVGRQLIADNQKLK